ncbi:MULTISPECIES: fumarylacetoacetate hydrolase family protein [unclassified Beijerinckia]|uniref:fumarylacetoacetate hydrolase family protein n=1 Tax=unclassified Beijerinckia TaxID=2638183 RepID=UPI00089A2B41|nr:MULTISPECIES: fumarylacetoacetate hydrolase family protein [unclassified Beijerinckia]MDH7799242.1 2,4-diketo-3-deoxy-L-fuconate hydrolase [Beijerinckia sp. GAS462]SED90951.1 2-keto-4-pentenoate hydratase/2-oxohepta-3-ene-1,7-dioic acid hydratase (catechol pathway) [Beijerinckia sp. 28-YEA-48]
MIQFALATYRKNGHVAPALMLDGQLYDFQDAAAAGARLPEATWMSNGLPEMLKDWSRSGPALTAFAEAVTKLVASNRLSAITDGLSKLTAPYRPERIYCAASNYIEHANEMGTVLAAKADSKPYMFLKLQNAVVGPNDEIRMPPETSQLDWEIELGAVIGTRGRRITAENALNHVAGYTIVNDITARDLNKRTDYPFKFDWFQGKCHDTFAPLGPWMVPASSIRDPQAVHMRLTVGNEVMQEDSTRNMIWTLREQIAYLSTIVTLEPGDVIATGTPTGVGIGRGIFLKAGDVVSAHIDGIGTLTNTVVAEQ